MELVGSCYGCGEENYGGVSGSDSAGNDAHAVYAVDLTEESSSVRSDFCNKSIVDGARTVITGNITVGEVSVGGRASEYVAVNDGVSSTAVSANGTSTVCEVVRGLCNIGSITAGTVEGMSGLIGGPSSVLILVVGRIKLTVLLSADGTGRLSLTGCSATCVATGV